MADWTSATLGQVCADGVIQTGPFGSQLHAEDYVDEGVPVVMPANISSGRIDESGIARIAEPDAVRLSRHRLQVGDIVYSRRGDITRCARITKREEGWLCGTGCLLVRPGSGAHHRWLAYWLSAPWTHEWLYRHAVGATMLNLNTSILSSLPVELPPLEDQRRIAAALGALDDLIEADSRQAGLLEDQARATAVTASGVAEVGQVATTVESRQVRPMGCVEHYSLPAFDNDRRPDFVDGTEIHSNKVPLAQSCVLVSRLNPKWERCWMAYPGPNSMASTEFVPLTGVGVETEELWAMTSGPAFWDQMRSRVTGTTGSHQRVDKAAVLGILVPDSRTLVGERRAAIVTLVRAAHALREEALELKAARDELLPLLMSGRVRVSEESEVE